jgi:hypothetical protein
MSISFSQARAAVLARREIDWEGTLGTLYVAPTGYADADDFLVEWGPREWLVDGDPSWVLLNNTATLVSRCTGEVRDEAASAVLDKLDRMQHAA